MSTNHPQLATPVQLTAMEPQYRATSQHTTATELRCPTTEPRCLSMEPPPQSVPVTEHLATTRRKTRTRSRVTAAATQHTTTVHPRSLTATEPRHLHTTRPAPSGELSTRRKTRTRSPATLTSTGCRVHPLSRLLNSFPPQPCVTCMMA